MQGSAREVLVSLCALAAGGLALGCGGPAPIAESDGGGTDGRVEMMDAPLPGADGGDGGATRCLTDVDCDDGVYCDGQERCMPGATDADARGCVEAATGPCAAGEECDEASATCDALCADADSDGHGALACGGDDCDDDDPNRHPGNVEVCDASAHDEDCNQETFGFLDADSDGAGSARCCNVRSGGELGCGDDCNDGDATVNSRAGDGPPLFCDGVDNDCSGTSDEGCPCVEGETRACGTDPQLMMVGICRPGRQVCAGGAFTESCIGATAAAEEVCDGLDNDCDGMADEAVLRTYHPDVDGDGFGDGTGAPALACSAPDGYASNDTDCDDAVASVNPGATEVCNAVDDNCTGGIDEGFVASFYADADGDGFGDATMATTACAPPVGYVRNASDCDDTNGSRNPATLEGCNTVDDNCNGMVDEGLLRTFYRDADGDAWGVTGTTMQACTPPAGYAERSGDCDDTRAASNPAAPEICNALDDNCAGGVDEGVLRTYYRDADRDSFGLDGSTMQACTAPAMHTDRGGDCVDTNASVNPSAAEACNGRDDNCDGATDTGCACTDGASRTCGPTSETGECTFGTQTCVAGAWGGCVGAVDVTTETCNGRDDDCDGTIDDGVTVAGCHRDGDGDGYGTGGATSQCRDAARSAFGFCPAGWVNVATDCNDGVSAIRPGATEVCDGVDQDCDGMADEGATIPCYGDADADGFGAGAAVQRCADAARAAFGMCPSGYTNVAMDCNDGASTVRPGAPEICNDVDDDCDTTVDDGVSVMPCHTDADGDGYGTGPATTRCRDATRIAYGYCPIGTTNVATDCNDGAASVRPGGSEVCNGLDDDCDGTPDELLLASGCYVDGDSDGYGAGTSGTQCRDSARAAFGFCPVGYTNVAGDCSDTNGAVRPAATEVCNGTDDDCDGTIDDGFECRPGVTPPMACTTGCGTAGTRACTSSCSFAACRTADEGPSVPSTCNGCDDDLDGATDDGFACARGAFLACTTACGTAGSRVCSATCTVPSACGAPVESCNFCDDDADGTIHDDQYIAFDTVIETVPGCASVIDDYYGGCGNVNYDMETYFGSDVSPRDYWDTFGPGSFAAWRRAPVRIGWGRVSFEATVLPVDFGVFPGRGWAFVIVAGSPELGSAGVDEVGAPIGKTGLAFEWSYHQAGAISSEIDEWRISRLDATGVNRFSYAWNDSPSTGLDQAADGYPIGVRIDYTPDNPITVVDEEVLAAWIDGSMVFSQTGVSLRDVFAPGTLVSVGVTTRTETGAGAGLHWIFSDPGTPRDIATVRSTCSPADGSLRLVEGSTSRTGRLEIFHGGEWGTVCDDVFDNTDAAVACRELGFSAGTATYGGPPGAGTIWLDDLGCTGSELRLSSCASPGWGVHNCSHSEDVGVSCTP